MASTQYPVPSTPNAAARGASQAPVCRTRWGWKLWLVLLTLVVLLASPGVVRADLHFEQTALDLGEVRTGLPLEKLFTFTNRGTEDVKITGLRPSCGCLLPDLKQHVFAPGEKGVIPLRVKTLGERAGPHSWRLHVSWRCGSVEKELALEVKALVVAEVNVEPGALLIQCSGALRHQLRLTVHRAESLKLHTLHATAPFLRVQASMPERSPEGRWITVIDVEATADCPLGRHEETLSLYTNDPVYRQIEVPITIVKRAAERMRVTPAVVEIIGVVGQPLAAKLLQVRDSQEQVVKLGKVTSEHAALRCTWAEGLDGSSTVKVVVDSAQLTEKELETRLRVEVQEPTRETILVPVRIRLD